MAKVSREEYHKQLTQLRAWIKPGDTVYTILEHVSRSGMQRTIRVLIPYPVREDVSTAGRCATCRDERSFPVIPRGSAGICGICQADWNEEASGRVISRLTGAVDFIHPNHAVSVVTGYPLDKARGRDGIKIGGCGMDMGFALVHSLSERLYGGRRCDCGRWFSDAQPTVGYLERRDDLRDQGAWHYHHDSACPKCKGSGNVIGTGYQCLGKGKCPSNYHRNHRDRVRCEGTRVHNPNGPDKGSPCYKPGGLFSRHEIPDNWPKLRIPVNETDEVIELSASCITDEDGSNPVICPTCRGEGDLPNPAGPERFDLEHFDGYAIRHRWL